MEKIITVLEIIVPIFVALAIIFCLKHNAYESFVAGAKEGIEVALKLFPYLSMSD